jgi:hypothetical protein
VVFGVLREISHGHSLLDLGGKLVGELVLKDFDLFEKLLFNVLGHPGSRAEGAIAHPQEIKNLTIHYTRG